MEPAMTDTRSRREGVSPAVWAGRVLGLLWGGFWTAFGLLSGLGERLSVPGILMHAVMPGLLFLAAALIAWRWQALGGVLLIAAGLAAGAYFPWARTVPGILVLPLPGIVAGLLMLADVAVRRRRT